MAYEQSVDQLDRWVGNWTTEATHPAFPDTVVHGTAAIEWLEGEHFLIHRARTDHPDFPDSVSVLGLVGRDRVGGASEPETRLCMHYYDSRGVFRDYDAGVDPEATLRLSIDAPDFGQRFTGRFADGGDTIDGQWEMCEDGAEWNDDLKITYRRG
jgi:hypothetical protein